MIIDEVKSTVSSQSLDGAFTVMNTLRDIVRRNYNEWFPTVAPIPPQQLAATGQVAVRPDLAILVVGYDPNGTPRMYHLISQMDFSPMLSNYGFAVQGVAQYALYLLNRLYEPDRTVEELTALAVYVITETASQDGKVGGPVKVITIESGEQGCQALENKAVDEIQRKNELRSRGLRDSFYDREVR